MSCEKRFVIDIPNHVASRLATVGDAVRLVQAQVAATMDATMGTSPARRLLRSRLDVGVAMRAILVLG